MKKWTDNSPNLRAIQLAFHEVKDYTTFRAEFAMDAGDIVFHFYKTPEIEGLGNLVRKYWADMFPLVLVEVSTAHFGVSEDSGRLKGQHVWDEGLGLDSWWFRAFSFGHLLDPHAVAFKFLERLDAGLDAALPSIRT